MSKTYRTHGFFDWLFCLAMVVAGAVLVPWILVEAPDNERWMSLFGVFFFIVGVGLARPCVQVDEMGIRIRNSFSTNRLRWQEIERFDFRTVTRSSDYRADWQEDWGHVVTSSGRIIEMKGVRGQKLGAMPAKEIVAILNERLKEARGT